MQTRHAIGSILAACCLGATALIATAQDATATLDPLLTTPSDMSTPADMMATPDMMASQPPMGNNMGVMGDAASAAIMDASGMQVGWLMVSPALGLPPLPTDLNGQSGQQGQPGQQDPNMMMNKVMVTIQVQGLTPGFHGMHMHMIGNCGDAGTGPFTAAGEHLSMGTAHPTHEGDFPALLVNNDGTGYLSFETDRLVVANLMDADGSALIIHANPDNYANIPERYGTPDQETLNAGDSGERVACGALQMGLDAMGMNNGMNGMNGSTGNSGTIGTDGMGGAVATTDPAMMPTTDPNMAPTTDPAMMPTTDPNMAPTATAGG